jgi:hypothetical protein
MRRSSHPVGSWNVFEISAGGPLITVKLNSREVSRLENTTREQRGLVLLFVVPECLDQACEDFRRSLEHGPELRLVYLVDVGAKMVDRLLQPTLHVLCVMARVTVFWLHGRAP